MKLKKRRVKSLKILLVDDDEIQRIKFKKVCKEIKSKNLIFEAENGEIALTLLENENKPFDLIISDLNMPRMNGFEFLENIKKNSRFKNAPIVIMSTSNNQTDLEKCFELGISGYFTKPLTYSKYSKKVTSLLKYWGKSEIMY